jgi:homocysteine S-methyltransferase
MNLFKQILQKQNVIILDGALGTEIQKRGFDVNDSLWSAKFLSKNPAVIKEIHTDYLNAGADIIISASYQASFEGFMKKGFSKEESKKLIELSISLAKDARDEFWENLTDKTDKIKPLVAASIGPYGAFLADGSEYSGNYQISDEELLAFHQQRLETILHVKPDIIACETIPSFNEAKILSKLLEAYDIPSWISFSAKDEKHINSGESIEECIEYLETQKHICALGINCTAPQFISSLVQKIKKLSSKPIVIYPNGGSKYNPITKTWEKSVDNSDFAKMALLWKNAGASIIGGCCETGPKEIQELHQIFFKT